MPYPTFFNLPEEKRQRILDLAIEEFAQNDYDSASISRIVARAGIAKGSLYQYFYDKSDLYKYLLDLALKKKAEMLASIPLNPNMGLFELLRSLFRLMSDYELRYPQFASIANRSLSSKSPLPEALILQGRQSSQLYFQSLIEKGKDRGEIRADVDAEVAAFVFTTLVAEMGMRVKKQMSQSPAESQSDTPTLTRSAEIEQMYNQIISILRDGIAV